MNYRKLGRTGITISEIAMGCEGFAGKSPAECKEMADYALKNGINFFDMYTSEPELRKNIGSALSGHKREDYVIQGHLCSAWTDGQYVRTRKPEEIVPAFEDLLRFMQTDYVDIGMIHYCDEISDYENIMNGEIIEYAKRLAAQGKIRCIGMSTHNIDIAARAADSGLIDVIMLSVNPAYDMLPPSDDINLLFERKSFDRVYKGIDPQREKLYRMCQSSGVAITVMKPFAGGLLLDEQQSPFGKALTTVQCISYCLDRPGIAAVMGGMSSIEQISSALHYYESDAQERDYSEILANAPRSSFSGHCMYCGHCAPCTAKIDIASVNKFSDLVSAQGFVSETVLNHYELLAHHAGECVSCGHCEKNCPFGVKIMEKMKHTASVFGK